MYYITDFVTMIMNNENYVNISTVRGSNSVCYGTIIN